MARIDPLWTSEPLTEADAIARFLEARGVRYERWRMADEVSAVASQPRLTETDKQALLDAFRAELAAKASGDGYVTADVVAIRPDAPGLSDALGRFDRLHFHEDDEVRVIVAGRGVFGFFGDDGRQFLLTVESGDYISVPAGVWHWFYCDEERFVTALRLFRDAAGWVPRYRDTERGVPAALHPAARPTDG